MTQQRNASCCENRAEAEMFAITLAGHVLNPRPLTRAREKAGKSGEKTYIRTRTRARPRTTRGKPRRDEEGVNFVWPLPPICAREHQCLSKRPSRPYRYKPHSYCRLSAQATAQVWVPAEDGSMIAFPRMPRVADLPPGWRHFTTAQKIEHLIVLDRCRAILSWGRSPSWTLPLLVSDAGDAHPVAGRPQGRARWNARSRGCPRARKGPHSRRAYKAV